MPCCIDNERGQATVEAAFVLPVFLLVLGLLVQPAVLLYTRGVMNAAAAESCRMLGTRTADEASARAFVERRLGAVPDMEAFHCGGEGAWEIEFSRAAQGATVQVKVVNRARPMPLFGILVGLAGSMEDGKIKQEVVARASLWPEWAAASGKDAADLVEAWK